MSVLAGQSLTADFTVVGSTGALTDADSTPTGTLVINGTDNAASVTVTNKTTGIYKAAVTVPATVAIGDVVQIRVNATVSSVVSGGYIFTGTVDNVSAQEIARIVYRSKQVMFVGEGGSDSNSGLTPTLAKLTVAAAASAASEESTIVVEAGEYLETSGVVLKAGQGLYGSGMFRTRIHNATTVEPDGVVNLADRTEAHTIYINGTIADGSFQAAISQYNQNTGAPVTSGLFQVRAKSDADGIYMRGTNASEYSTIYNFDSIIDANYDAMAQFQYSKTYTFGGMYRSIGPSLVTGWPGVSNAVKSSGTAGDQYIFGTALVAKDGTVKTSASVKSGSGDVLIVGANMFTKSSEGDTYHLETGSGGAIYLRDVNYESTKVTGTIIPNVVNTLSDANVTQWLGTAAATPTTAGIPKVEVPAADIRAALGMSAADLDTQLDAIVASTALITSGNINVIGNVAGTNVTINQGETSSSTLNPLLFTITSGETWPTDLTSYTITLIANQVEDTSGNPPTSPASISQSGSVVTATGSSRAVRIDATAAQTALYTPGLYDYYVKATTGSGASTVDWLRQGQLRVIDSNPNA